MDRLDPKTTVLLVVDVQEKLAAAMEPDTLERVVKNAGILVDAAKILGVPVVTTEQYPKGLGPTVPALMEKLPNVPHPKMTFDAASDLAVARTLADLAPHAVVVVGMETHVCVFQTARELVRRGFAAHVVSDAVCSRKDKNRKLGLSLCERAGAVITGTETVVFDLLQIAGTEQFKAISKLVR